MKITLNVDGPLLKRVMAAMGTTNKTRAIEHVLREADRRTVWIYLAVLAAALTRLCAPLHDNSPVLLAVSAGLWTLAFGGFALVYGPLLIGQRAGRAG